MRAMADDGAVEEVFATDTMAELCARQGRLAEAAAIFGRLLQRDPEDARAARWTERLAELRAQAVNGVAPPSGAPSPPTRGARPAASGAAAVPARAAAVPARAATAHAPVSELRMPLVIRETVRSGQIVYAQGTDLIVLAPVNVGAQLLADGNIHVYAALRGRAVAGARGERSARIFCQRLEAELVGVDAAYVTAEGLPTELFGKAAQVWLDDERCVVGPLP
jgi:septum site-determining protein MinC